MDTRWVDEAWKAGGRGARGLFLMFALAAVLLVIVPIFTVTRFVSYDAGFATMLVTLATLLAALWFIPNRRREARDEHSQ